MPSEHQYHCGVAASIGAPPVDAPLEREEQREGKLAALRSAIDEGDASGIAEDGVLDRVRDRAGLPARSR